MPLNRFIDVIVDDTYGALIIEGKPSDKELADAWAEIRLQYADAMKDAEYRHVLGLQKELYNAETTYTQILFLVDQLRKIYVKQFADLLNKLLKTSLVFDVTKPEQYDHNLDRAFRRSKGVKIEIFLKKENLASKISKMETGKPSREYFAKILLAFENYWQMRFADDMSVFAFCERVHMLNKESDKLKAKQWRKK